MDKTLQQCFIILISASFLSVASYYYIDKPVAYWMNAHSLLQYRDLPALTNLEHIPLVNTFLSWRTLSNLLLLLIIPVVYCVLAIRYCYHRFTDNDRNLLFIANSVAIALFFKTQLKFLFGRYWPTTWVYDNLSLIQNNVYGFNWFQGTTVNAAFPSGHSAWIFAMATACWISYPRSRWFCILAPMLVCTCLIVLDYHFVSDIIAGGSLGIVVALMTAKLSGIK